MATTRKTKTHKGLAKRVKLTGTGKLLRRRAGKSHLNSGKGGRRLQKLAKAFTIPKHMAKVLKDQLYS